MKDFAIGATFAIIAGLGLSALVCRAIDLAFESGRVAGHVERPR